MDYAKRADMIEDLVSDLCDDVREWNDRGCPDWYGARSINGRVNATKTGILRSIKVIRQQLLQLEKDMT